MKLAHVLGGIAAAVLSLNALAITAGSSTLVDFSDGTDGWAGRVGPPVAGGTTWDTSLGNAAPALHTVYNDFLKVGIRDYTDTAAFTGDYTQAQSITLSFDVDVLHMEVGSAAGAVNKDIYLDLLDYDHPSDFYDASFISIDLGTLTEGTGWQTLSVTLNPADFATGLPAGWTAVDANGTPTIADDLTFEQLLADVNEIAFRMSGTKSGGAWAYDVAVDNISISSTAAVPEPAPALMLLLGALTLGLRRVRASKR